MSIASEVNRIKDNITSAYSALSYKGAEIPSAKDSDHLSTAIETMPQPVTAATIRSKNLLDLNALTTGKELDPGSGAVTDNMIRSITNYIPVVSGMYLVSSYYVNRVLKPYSMVAVCFYDADKQYLCGVGYQPYVTVPEGAVYVRVCGNSYMPRKEFKAQLELSDKPYPTFFEPFRSEMPGLEDSILEANRILTQSSRNSSFCLALPRRIFATAGKTVRIYHRNILSHPKYTIAFYYADKKNASDTVAVTVKNFDDYAAFITSGSGSVLIPFAVYDDDFRLIAYDNLELQVTEAEAPSASVVIIGDSTVELDNVLEAQLQSLYRGTSSTLTLLGTRGSADNAHEGRSGWKAEDYVSTASKDSTANAFWDGEKFNFSYYVQQQGYASVDAVIIQLGINDLINAAVEDLTPETIVGYIDEMVDSVKSYSDSVQIIVDLVIPPNSNGVSFAEKYHGMQAEWLYRYNTIRYNERLIEQYRGDDRVTVLGINTILETNTDIRDGVHPRTAGQEKIAGVIYDCLANITGGII